VQIILSHSLQDLKEYFVLDLPMESAFSRVSTHHLKAKKNIVSLARQFQVHARKPFLKSPGTIPHLKQLEGMAPRPLHQLLLALLHFSLTTLGNSWMAQGLAIMKVYVSFL